MENNLKPFDKVLVRNYDYEDWKIDVFEKYDRLTESYYICMKNSWNQCIPYEGNEYLFETSNSLQEENKKEDYTDEYEINSFKKGDIVLVRDEKSEKWQLEAFVEYNSKLDYPFVCTVSSWNQCILYEGNEHLVGTTHTPEKPNYHKNTHYDIKLKPGYILELKNGEAGMIFPVYKENSSNIIELALFYTTGGWDSLDSINETEIMAIRKIVKDNNIPYSILLWERKDLKKDLNN